MDNNRVSVKNFQLTQTHALLADQDSSYRRYQSCCVSVTSMNCLGQCAEHLSSSSLHIISWTISMKTLSRIIVWTEKIQLCFSSKAWENSSMALGSHPKCMSVDSKELGSSTTFTCTPCQKLIKPPVIHYGWLHRESQLCTFSQVPGPGG